VRSKAGKSQLNLRHGTKAKPDMQKTVSSQSPLYVIIVWVDWNWTSN